MKKLFILDASGYLYRAYFAIRQMTNDEGESTNALFGFIRSILKLFKDFHPDYFVAVFDGPASIKGRKEIYTEYKANRKKAPDDLYHQIQWAEQFCDLMGISSLSIPDVEADDTMGTVTKWAEKQGFDVYLCTSDKDMSQLVSSHVFLLNTHKDNLILDPEGVRATYGVPPEQIIDLLAIAGDTSDNVPGIPGFGLKTAARLLQEVGSLEKLLADPVAVLSEKKAEAVFEHGEMAEVSKQLVTIKCDVEIPKEEPFFQLKSANIPELKTFYRKKSFFSLLKELDENHKEEELVAYKLVDERSALEALVVSLMKEKQVCIDTETTHYLPLEAELVGIGLGVKPKQAWYVPLNGQLGKQTVLQLLKPLFENSDVSFYGQNIKYDLHVLQNAGLSLPSICFDTILASYLLRAHKRNHSLDHLALEHFGKIKTPISDLIGKGKQQITMREVPIDKVCTYCCEDVDYTCRLKELLEKELVQRGLSHLLFEIELPLLTILAKMESRGIFVDVQELQAMSKQLSVKLDEIKKQVYALAGEEFNLNSPKQLSEILFTKLEIPPPKKTKTGFSTNADVLEKLSETYPIAKLLLEWRSLEKLRSTYLDALPQQVMPKTGRVHCTFNQFVAATGRLSCQDPNLQNIPVRTEVGRQIRHAFRPEKQGWSFLSADYSQIELRLLAHFSEDPTLLEAFHTGQDVHAHTAATIFDLPLEKVTKQLRYRAKAVNFGVIYGQQAFGLARELGIEVNDAQAFIDSYFERYPRVLEFVKKCKEETRETGRSVTLLGRERQIPEILSNNIQIRNAAERLAVNTPLQGTSADLIKKAMIRIDKELQKSAFSAFMVLQIHDELIFELPDQELLQLKPLVQEAMQTVIPLKVPIIVDLTVGKNWMEC